MSVGYSVGGKWLHLFMGKNTISHQIFISACGRDPGRDNWRDPVCYLISLWLHQIWLDEWESYLSNHYSFPCSKLPIEVSSSYIGINTLSGSPICLLVTLFKYCIFPVYLYSLHFFFHQFLFPSFLCLPEIFTIQISCRGFFFFFSFLFVDVWHCSWTFM